LRRKPDISTWQRLGHFYLALTRLNGSEWQQDGKTPSRVAPRTIRKALGDAWRMRLERSIAMRNTSCASRIESIDSLPMMGRKAVRTGARGEEIFIGY
jgi:hypothetical protein